MQEQERVCEYLCFICEDRTVDKVKNIEERKTRKKIKDSQVTNKSIAI